MEGQLREARALRKESERDRRVNEALAALKSQYKDREWPLLPSSLPAWLPFCWLPVLLLLLAVLLAHAEPALPVLCQPRPTGRPHSTTLPFCLPFVGIAPTPCRRVRARGALGRDPGQALCAGGHRRHGARF